MSTTALSQRLSLPSNNPTLSSSSQSSSSTNSSPNKSSNLRTLQSTSSPLTHQSSLPSSPNLNHITTSVTSITPPTYSHHLPTLSPSTFHQSHSSYHHHQSISCPKSRLTLNLPDQHSPSSTSSPLILSSLRSPLSPSYSTAPDSPLMIPSHILELNQSSNYHQSGLISREPSLPSIMSMPSTRPTSPDLGKNKKTSLLKQKLNHSINTSIRSSNPSSPRITSRIFSPLGHVSNLCAFEDGLQHYERVRSPSLKGHSRRQSLINLSINNQPNFDIEKEMFQFDLSEDLGEETICQVKLNQSQDYSDLHGGDNNKDISNNINNDDQSDNDDDDEHGKVPKVFKIGQRIGVGTLHQGYIVRDLFQTSSEDSRTINSSNTGNHSILEIVRQIGVGSYAVVYLVREVLYDPDLQTEITPLDTSLSQTPKASDGFASLSNFGSNSLRHQRKSTQVIYGRDFALKCLCKRNLTDELLILQRGEAELHRSLPLHENIVALHQALETPNWLFLVIEYCPGQDLFYWLEQARDSQDLESLASRTNSFARNFPSSNRIPSTIRDEVSSDLTTIDDDSPAGPNTPPSPSLLASTADDEMLSRRRLRLISRMFVQMCDAVEACHQAGVCHRDIKPENFIVVDNRKARTNDQQSIGRNSVIVKITDWGLGTSSKNCDDFDCGSKPYMAYECRNNLNPTYDPVEADVWSLGIVLLNLLYHRCPWADPTLANSDFVEYKNSPIGFLRDRFEGMTMAVANFLAERVFCEVGLGLKQHRVSAGGFGEWAKDLLYHLDGGQPRASVSNATIALTSSTARSTIEQRQSYHSLSVELIPRRSSELFHSINLPDVVPEDLSPLNSSNQSINQNPLHLSNPLTQDFSSLNSQSLKPHQISQINDEKTQESGFYSGYDCLDIKPEMILSNLDGQDCQVNGSSDHPKGSSLDDESCLSSNGKNLGEKQRRRKRGARKGRRTDGGKRHGIETVPNSPQNEPAELDMLDGLVEVSQSLAREISQATKSKKLVDNKTQAVTTSKRKMNLAERMMEKFRDGSNPDLQAFIARARAREAAFMGKVNSNTASAPAQLQDINRLNGRNNPVRGTLSISSSAITSLSTNSATSWGTSSESTSSSKAAHWSSAANRRERIQKTHQPLADPPVLTNLTSHKEASTSTTSLNKKEESKNKLALLLTSFKRFNSTIGNHNNTSVFTTNVDNP
ncbi:hypothetical protein O181_007172 [Austropuccinia psidii MF-1]|uniref:non-specific serine/threonine protein kinase n=1 Tax=Austropuccinia psidii MF-1 TaxID=1389203 RepID=A0A9Q3GI81_9BASI|nr:hypothetical protein [Austropuccinia psidii MF-1]